MNSNIDLPITWDEEIRDLDIWFQGQLMLPDTLTIGYKKIVDLNACIKSYMSIVKAQNGCEAYRPYLNHLIEIKNTLSGRI